MGDIIYEGARGVNGQYLQLHDVNALTVGLVIGAGEFLGYAFRLFSGVTADRTRSYWLFTIIGYAMLIAIPLISVASAWQMIALFIIVERVGKGIRTPSRDTIISHAGHHVGTGFGFGLAELLDQIGAVAGPFIFAILLVSESSKSQLIASYRSGYGVLWIPFGLLLLIIFITYRKYKSTEQFETRGTTADNKASKKIFWSYNAFVFITALGFISFALIGFHVKKHGIMSDSLIAVLYAIAMAMDAVTAVLIGKYYDRLKSRLINRSYRTLLFAPILASFIPALVFSTNIMLIVAGIIAFGIVVGIQETIFKAAIADMTHISKRSTSFGIFNVSFGLACFLGNSIAGLLYDVSIPLLIVFCVTAEALSIPLFIRLVRHSNT